MNFSVRGVQSLEEAQLSAYKAAANVAAVPLPIVGSVVDGPYVSLVVEVPYASVSRFEDEHHQWTRVRIRGAHSALLSVPNILSGEEPLGYVLAVRPIVIVGDAHQPDDADYAVALLDEALQIDAPCIGHTIGPKRCVRCNHPIPPGRAHMAGSSALCIRCKSNQETTQ